jgi:FlaA1/EpsC-like NDP-sugar epimerase
VTDQRQTSKSSPRNAVARPAAAARPVVPLVNLDVVSVIGAYMVAMVLRFDGAVPGEYWDRFWRYLPVAILVHVATAAAFGLYGPVWRHAGAVEARRVLLAWIAATAVLNATLLFDDESLPRSVFLVGPSVQMAFGGIVRFQSRLFAFRRSGERSSGIRVVIAGAGADGAAAAREMRRSPRLGLLPVAFIDDDPRLQSRSVAGIPVAGTLADVPMVVARTGANQVLLAIREPGSHVVRALADDADRAGVSLKVLPAMTGVDLEGSSVRDARDLRIEDLLGRNETTTDLEAVGKLLSGRRVLVTGGGGSIGSEIARQVATFGPAALAILDNDETHLHDAEAGIDGPAELLLADIRDRRRIFELFERFQPEVVFHAAALKHVPMLESHPCEAVMTNVVGTCNVLDGADHIGVEHVVFVSTDKAVRPTSVMGASKWLGEQLTLARSRAQYRCAVRFGNVLGSRGSVVPTFTRQIMAGGPVTVTDPAMTRYFMSIPEAVQLVLQAAVLTERREIFMLDMGEPMRIMDLAERMIRLTGRTPGVDIAIEVTGIRPGEKLAEELCRPDEATSPTEHPAIVRLDPSAQDRRDLVRLVDELVGAASAGHGDQVRCSLLSAARRGLHDRVIDLTDGHLLEGRSSTWSSSTT